MAESTEGITALSDNIVKNFQRFSPVQRMMLLALLALAVAAMFVFILMGQEPDMAVLFSNLEEEDAQVIVMRLGVQNVPYTMGPDGKTIMVPNDRVHTLRIQMASEGLPDASGVGFEIFDRTNFGVGEFAQKINYRRALQGELARTISVLPSVQRARVHLVIPERRLFSSDQEPSRAAVVVIPRRGKTLTASQVHGIVHLVASSVEGLDPSEVAVVDGQGQMLSQSKEGETAQLSSAQLDKLRNREASLERRVQTMLDQVLGQKKTVVRVSADLEFQKVEVTNEQYDPEGQVVRSEQRSQEKVIGSDGPSGVPGVRSNVPNEEAPETASGTPNEAKRKNETVNYEVNRKVSRTVIPSGTLKRLSVSVLVDGTYESLVNEETGETTLTYVPRSDEEMASLMEIVKAAVGFSEKRGDQIEMSNRQFVAHTVEGEDPSSVGLLQEFFMVWGGYLKPLVLLVLGLFVLLIVVRPLVKSIIAPPVTALQELPEGLPATVAQLEAQKEGPKIKEISPEEQAVTMAVENPQAAAFVIREWMKEDLEPKNVEA